MKGLLIILIVFGAVILAAVAFVLVPNLLTPAAPALPDAPQGVATPTLAAPPVANPPPGGQSATPPAAALPAVGSAGQSAFNGVFAGTLTSDDGSTAPVTLDLTQTGTTVAGDITIGQGLNIDGGNCGQQAVPSGSRSVTGQTDPSNPNHIEVTAGYNVQGFDVTAEFVADLSGDGNTLNSQIAIKLPFLCGRSPVITGTLQRQ